MDKIRLQLPRRIGFRRGRHPTYWSIEASRKSNELSITAYKVQQQNIMPMDVGNDHSSCTRSNKISRQQTKYNGNEYDTCKQLIIHSFINYHTMQSCFEYHSLFFFLNFFLGQYTYKINSVAQCNLS